jgi:hypothetical protein
MDGVIHIDVDTSRRRKSRDAMRRKRAALTEPEKEERRILERERRARKKAKFEKLEESHARLEDIAERFAEILLIIKQSVPPSSVVHEIINEEVMLDIRMFKPLDLGTTIVPVSDKS